MRPFLIPFLLLFATVSAAAQSQVAVRELARGLEAPVGITHAGDARLFITLQRGRVMIFDGTTLAATPFLDISSRVSCCGEQGLLSIAFHPRYRENGFFFVNYTDRAGDTVVARYSVSSSDPNRADADSEMMLLRVDQPFANHNGGQLQFGPDGYLYIGLGDGGAGGDPGNRAQSLTTHLGKILRIDVSSATPYAIPPTNPFVNRSDARPEIWSYGWRNPWRFSFDRDNGDLWIADVGQGEWEEVSVQPFTSIGGENYGWKKMEGSHCFSPAQNCREASMVLPVIEYGHGSGACSVTGGYRYRGTRQPRLRGMYIYGDFCNGVISGALPAADGSWSSRVLLDTNFTISTFGEDIDGELYVGDYTAGRLLQLYDAAPLPRRRRAVGR